MTTEIKKTYYESGKVKTTQTYVIDELYNFCKTQDPPIPFPYGEKMLDGLSKEWYENSKLKKECNYVKRELNGLYKSWYKNGQLKEDCEYKNDEVNGLYKSWASMVS